MSCCEIFGHGNRSLEQVPLEDSIAHLTQQKVILLFFNALDHVITSEHLQHAEHEPEHAASFGARRRVKDELPVNLHRVEVIVGKQ